MNANKIEVDYGIALVAVPNQLCNTFEVLDLPQKPRYRIGDGPWQDLPAGARIEERDGELVLVTS